MAQMPMYGQMPPKKKLMPGRRMMAGGAPPDLSSPSEIDSPPSSGAALPQDPDQDQDNDSSMVTPEMLDYHTGADNCGACSHMMGDGSCEVLKMPVGETDWCKAFTGSSGDASGAEPMGGNPEMQPS